MKRGMKMAAVSTISLLLLCCSAISSTDSKEVCNLHAATSADVTVPLGATLAPTDMLKWMHNNELIFHRKGEKVVFERDKKRESVSENGFLKLTNVMKSDAGQYTPMVYLSNGRAKGTLEVQHLCIMDRVPTPSVKVECKPTTDVPSVVFTCFVQATQTKGLQFAWLQSSKPLEKETGQTLKKPIGQMKTDPISCKVSNPASSLTSAPVTHTCVVNELSIFPSELFGINTWIFVGAGGGVVVVLIILVIVCCICTKRRKRMRLKEEGELRLAWTKDQQPPPDLLHPHRPQQQPAGHTGPRQQRSRQQRDQQRPRAAADHPNPRPQASPRRPAQAPRPPVQIDEEQPPPLPQPRKNVAKTQRV